jgi:hypothetical protein
MRQCILASWFCLLLFASCSSDDSRTQKGLSLIDVDFDRSLGFRGFRKKNIDIVFASPFDRIQVLKKIYQTRKPSQIKSLAEPRIPKIIHQIWLDVRPPSKAQIEWIKSIRKLHPTWQYHLWTSQEIAAFEFDLKDVFLKARSSKEKEDILRAEILDRFGGLCIDCDFEALKPFDQLHFKYDFYSGLLFDEDSFTISRFGLSSSLVAARPGHPIVKEWKEGIKKVFLQKKNMPCQNDISSAPFAQAVFKNITKNNTDVVLPPTYFYPLKSSELSNWYRMKLSAIKRTTHAFLRFCNIIKSSPFTEIRPETLSIYHWGGRASKTTEERLLDLYQNLLHLENEMLTELHEVKGEIQYLKQSVEAQDK